MAKGTEERSGVSIVDEIEWATARLEADPFDAEALANREAAVNRLRDVSPQSDQLGRLEAARAGGERVEQRLLLAREQVRRTLAQSAREAAVAGIYASGSDRRTLIFED